MVASFNFWCYTLARHEGHEHEKLTETLSISCIQNTVLAISVQCKTYSNTLKILKNGSFIRFPVLKLARNIESQCQKLCQKLIYHRVSGIQSLA